MKVQENTYRSHHPRHMPPPLPLIPEKDERKEKGQVETQKLKLKVDPSSEDSDTYGVEVQTINNPTTSSYVEWRKAFERIMKGLNLKGGTQLYAMARSLLRGRMQRAFEKAAAELKPENSTNFFRVLNELSVEVFPPRALVKQKRYMRRYMRKPAEVSIRTYHGLIGEMNANFRFFPDADETDQLGEDELVDIVEAGLPKAWTKQMLLQDFDPAEHTLHELVDFCERLENAEQIYEGEFHNKKSQKANRDGTSGAKHGGELPAKSDQRGRHSKSKNSAKRSRKDRDETWCELHASDDHDTRECRVLLAQAKRMREAWKSARSTKNYRSSKDSKSKESSNSISRKSGRKSSRSKSREHSSSSESGSGSEHELNEFSKVSFTSSDDSKRLRTSSESNHE